MNENEVYVAFQGLFDRLSPDYTPEQIDDMLMGAFEEWVEANFESSDEEEEE